MTAASIAANLGGVALFALPGLGLTELLAPLRRLPLPRRLAYGLLLGVLAVAGSLFAASHLFGVPLRRPAILLSAALPAALGLGAWIRHRHAIRRLPEAPDPGRRRRFAAVLVIFAVCLGPLASVLAAPLADWDGRMTWSALAAYMRHEGTVNPSVLRDGHWLVVHPRYPPLLPVAQAAVQELFGAGEDEENFRALYVSFFVALLLVVHDGARRVGGRSAAALTALCVALPPFLHYGAGGATSAYSDMPLACFYGGALVLLLLAQPDLPSGLTAGCLLAGAVLTKSEGAPLAAAALLLAALRVPALLRASSGRVGPSPLGGGGLEQRGGKTAFGWLGAAILPVLAAVALLASWRAAIPNRDDEDYLAGLRLTDLLHGAFARLPVIVPEILHWTFRWADWLGFWGLFLVILIGGWRALGRPRVRRMLLAGLAPAVIGWAAYAVSTSLGELIGQTWDRFLLQGMVPLAVAFAAALERILSGSSRAPGPPHGTS